jgi:ribonuclease P protein component
MITDSLSWPAFYGPGDNRRKHLEKNFSTKQCLQKENTRIQGPHEHQGRPTDPQKKACQRKKAFDGLTGQADLRFPRAVRIRSRNDYLRIQKTGQKVRGHYLILLTAHNDLPVSRFGITVSKRNRNAVKRNSIKRKIREIQRLNRGCFLSGNDVVIIARQTASEATFEQLETEYLGLARAADLVEKD